MPVALGVDYGEKRIGLAISDGLMMTANPLDTIKRTTEERDLAQIQKIVKEREVDIVVVGLPLNMDGSEGPSAKYARAFADKIHEVTGLAIEMWDERLSSKAAEAVLIQADLTRKKRKGKVDRVAAAWFLQSYLDAKR